MGGMETINLVDINRIDTVVNYEWLSRSGKNDYPKISPKQPILKALIELKD